MAAAPDARYTDIILYTSGSLVLVVLLLLAGLYRGQVLHGRHPRPPATVQKLSRFPLARQVLPPGPVSHRETRPPRPTTAQCQQANQASRFAVLPGVRLLGQVKLVPGAGRPSFLQRPPLACWPRESRPPAGPTVGVPPGQVGCAEGACGCRLQAGRTPGRLRFPLS